MHKFMERLVSKAIAELGWNYTWFILVSSDLAGVEIKVVGEGSEIVGYMWSKEFIDRYGDDEDVIDEGMGSIMHRLEG